MNKSLISDIPTCLEKPWPRIMYPNPFFLGNWYDILNNIFFLYNRVPKPKEKKNSKLNKNSSGEGNHTKHY